MAGTEGAIMEDKLRREIDRRMTRYWASCQAFEQRDFAAKAFDRCLREFQQAELRRSKRPAFAERSSVNRQ